MNEPILQTDAELVRADDWRLTEIAVVNPSIALLETRGRLKVLISRDTFRERTTTQFMGARVVDIPLGRRLAMLKFFARFCRVRLPTEYDFLDVKIEHHDANGGIATADGDFLCRVHDASLIRPLTGREYFALMTIRGRELHRWVNDHFPVSGVLGANFANGSASRRRVA